MDQFWVGAIVCFLVWVLGYFQGRLESWRIAWKLASLFMIVLIYSLTDGRTVLMPLMKWRNQLLGYVFFGVVDIGVTAENFGLIP